MITTVNLNDKNYKKLRTILTIKGKTFKEWLDEKIKEECIKYDVDSSLSEINTDEVNKW